MTEREIYQFLREKGHNEAALDLADAILQITPEDWAKENVASYARKIPFIKEMRRRFGVSLKESKQIVDRVWDQ